MKAYILFIIFLTRSFASFSTPYFLTENYVGSGFYDHFIFEDMDDPTHGRVEYVSQTTARALNLSYATDREFIMRADSKTHLSPSDKGRKSLRIRSKKAYSHDTVLVADIAHMPQGCGTWPALWMCGRNWPHDGEIDIVEGINDQSPNRASLHSSPNCTQPQYRPQTGISEETNCDVRENYNSGCGVKMTKPFNYGPDFNSQGGGWFAVERSQSEINIWFWQRNEPNVPPDVSTPGQYFVNPSAWGLPAARFSNSQCDLTSHFKDEFIIINLTFCGDWGGTNYAKSGCPSTCVAFVNENPEAFRDAFWNIYAIRILGGGLVETYMAPLAPRGLAAALNASGKYMFRPPEFEVDHLIVGAGVVGLAIARKLSIEHPHKSSYLIERHSRPGEETSSRNSEVIHGGFYYPVDSLKTKLCIRGRHLLYKYCESRNVPFKKVGKLVVGNATQRTYIENLFRKAESLKWSQIGLKEDEFSAAPVYTRLLSGNEARELEPDIAPDIDIALHSPETGIIDSHSFMEALEEDISGADSASVVCGTSVVRVDPVEDGWVVQLKTGSDSSNDTDSVKAKTLINSSGLSAPFILNALNHSSGRDLPRIPIWYSPGSYISYRGPGVSNVKHLIYPVPDSGGKNHGFAGLGTHLTIDLEGNIRFGPDIQWVDPPGKDHDGLVLDESAIDFWTEHLSASMIQATSMCASIRQYLPGVNPNGFSPDYVGIRPKRGPPNSGFQDFHIQHDFSGTYRSINSPRGGHMITLLGIESPGLTSSLAIADEVVYSLLQ